jgi:membrane protease YdiL (CAAX protease family)
MNKVEYLLLLFWLLFIVFGCVALYLGFTKPGSKTNKAKVEREEPPKPQKTYALSKTIPISRAATVSLWLYFLAIASAELLTVFLQPWAGIICHTIILIAFTVQPGFVGESRRRYFILGLSLVPLIRIISLSLPLTDLPQIYWYPLIYAPLLAATVVVMWVVGLKPRDVGLAIHNIPLQIVVAVVTGAAFGIIEYLILRPEPLVVSLTFEQVWLPAVILLLTTGFVEELIFRGVLQELAESAMGMWGLIYVSLIFAILHVGFFSFLDVVFIVFIALFYAVVRKKTGSLLGVILSHGITNSVLFLVAPFVLG